jgi:hypothetical protein
MPASAAGHGNSLVSHPGTAPGTIGQCLERTPS